MKHFAKVRRDHDNHFKIENNSQKRRSVSLFRIRELCKSDLIGFLPRGLYESSI